MEKKQRAKVGCKTDLVEAYVPVITALTGAKISKEKAWNIFKQTMFTAFELAKEKPLSLSGLGRFYTVDSARSLKVNKPAGRMRFSASGKIHEVLAVGGSYLNLPADPVDDCVCEDCECDEDPTQVNDQSQATPTITAPATDQI